jgi:hypothetical protein
VDPDTHGSAFWSAGAGSGSRKGKKTPPQKEKSEEISYFKVLDVPFCGLEASLVAWTSFIHTWRPREKCIQIFLIKK